MNTVLAKADIARISHIRNTSNEVRSLYSQYLTPPQTAELAASMFSSADNPSCLDLGCGTGILSVALCERYGSTITIDAIDLDSTMLSIYDAELSAIGVNHHTFLEDAITSHSLGLYDRIILNPPYKKMAASDNRQKVLPARSPNLYSAFLMVAAKHLENNGECVAIIPRSWMNGQYFQPFREWLFDTVSLDAMHIYGSRTDIFSDTDVLQETMLIKFSKRNQSKVVCVSESDDKTSSPTISEYKFNELVDSRDKTVRVKPELIHANLAPLHERGFCASTGKVVDFRASNYIRSFAGDGVSRFVYAHNFQNGTFTHPVESGKPQWFEATDSQSARQLIGPGCTVIVKRFSSKEEKRRVSAFLLDMDEPMAIENHLNYIHAGTPRKTILADKITAKGIALWLMSTWVDKWFRDVSGSTQVNASDLNKMPIPSIEVLHRLGKKWQPRLSQEAIDSICKEVVFDA